MAKSRKAAFAQASDVPASLIKNPDDPSFRDWENVYNEILKAAVSCEKSNPEFFWAASKMILPQLEIKTIFYGQQAGSFRDLTEIKGGLGRTARKFAAAMDLSFEKGGDNLPEAIRSDVAHLLTHHKMSNFLANPQPAKAREFAVA